MNIQIKVDPQNQAVPAADKITASLHRVEEAGTKAGAATATGMKAASTASVAAADAVGSLGEKMRKELAPNQFDGFHSFGNGLKEMAKGHAMGAIRQGLGSIASELGKVAGVDISGTGTSIGFMFGGPLGAAIGTGIELLGNYGMSMDDMIERARRMGETGAQTFARLTEGAKTFNDQLGALATGATSMDDMVVMLTTHLGRLHGVLSSFSSLPGILDDVNMELAEANDILGAANDPREQYIRTTKVLAGLLENGKIPIDDYGNALTEATEKFLSADAGLSNLNDSLKKGEKAAQEYARSLEEAFAYEQKLLLGKLNREEAEGVATIREQARIAEMNAGVRYVDVNSLQAPKFSEDDPSKGLADKKTGDKLLEDTRKEIERLDREAFKPLIDSARMFGDALVEHLFDAESSWSDFFAGIAEDLSKKLLKDATKGLLDIGIAAALSGGATGFDAMVPGGRGAFLPGFASGGDMMVGGAGGTDSKIAAFRVTPGESIHVRTPQQRSAAEASSGGGPRTVNVYVPGGTNGRVISEDNIEGMVVKVVERNQHLIGRITGR